MDKELNALRRVAKAAKKYQDRVIQKQNLQASSGYERNNSSGGSVEFGSIDFELAEALNEWYRTQFKSA